MSTVVTITSPHSAASVPPTTAWLSRFHPGWFAAVMGTAVIGVVANMNPGNQPALKGAFEALAVAMVALAYGFAVALGIPYIARLVRYPVAAWHDLAHPAVGPLFATFPAGLLVLAAATAAVGTRVLPTHTVSTIVAVLAVAGCILAFTLAVTFGYLLFAAPNVEAEQASGAWFIPPVVTIVIPLALVPLVPVATTAMARFLLVASYAAWGMGFFLFLLTAALLYARYVYHPLPKAPLAPAFWIGLGPIGVGGLTLLRLAQVSGAVWPGTSVATVTAHTKSGASCTAAVVYDNGRIPTNFHGVAEVAATGVDTWTWHEETKSTGGMATVTCTKGSKTHTGSAHFVVR